MIQYKIIVFLLTFTERSFSGESPTSKIKSSSVLDVFGLPPFFSFWLSTQNVFGRKYLNYPNEYIIPLLVHLFSFSMVHFFLVEETYVGFPGKLQ